MGMMFRRRRPLMRMAAGAATARVAYEAGRRRAEEEEPPRATEASTPAPPVTDSVGELDRLVELHRSGALDDDEFAAAKSKLLGL